LRNALLDNISHKYFTVYLSKVSMEYLRKEIHYDEICMSPVPEELERRDCGRSNDCRTFIVIKEI
jgi:hypothetical protein